MLFGCGCLSGPSSRSAFLHDLATLEARVAQRRAQEALAQVEGLKSRTVKPEERCPILVAEARALGSLHRLSEAVSTFREAARACRGVPQESARGLFELAVFLAQRAGDPMEALPVFRRVVTQFPDEPAARRAAVWLLTLQRERSGTEAAVEEMRRLYREVPRADVAPFLLFQAAVALERESDRSGLDMRNQRLALWLLILQRHAGSRVADDAGVAAARLCLESGRPWVAVRLLHDVLARRETSWFLGSYDTPIYAEAAYWIATARLAATRDRVAAAADLVRFATEFPDDPRVAEALFTAYQWLVSAARRDEALKILRVLAQVRPNTVHGREARRILEQER